MFLLLELDVSPKALALQTNDVSAMLLEIEVLLLSLDLLLRTWIVDLVVCGSDLIDWVWWFW